MTWSSRTRTYPRMVGLPRENDAVGLAASLARPALSNIFALSVDNDTEAHPSNRWLGQFGWGVRTRACIRPSSATHH
jgi:hypothetical protein